MKILVHAGMHKTGSSSIQSTFSRLRQEVYTWAPATRWVTGHNTTFALCFLPEAELPEHWLFQQDGLTLPCLLALKKRYMQRLDAAIAGSRPLLVFSQESMNGRMAGAMQRFVGYCRGVTSDLQALVYVRPPVSFAVSMFQEVLKSETDSRRISLVQPAEYRQRFEAVEECFGRRRVKYKLFDRRCLKGGNVALDFAHELGVPLKPEQVVESNERLPLQAVALLHAFKSLLPPRRPRPGRIERNHRFAWRLAALGQTRLRYTPGLAAEVRQSQRADIAWMEARLGRSLAERPARKGAAEDAAPAIGSLEDLLPLAERQTEAVERLAGVRAPAPAGASRRQRLLYALTHLHDRA